MPTQSETEVLDRLFDIAKGGTAQSRRVADFLLTWWDAGRNGGFDLTAMWSLDEDVCKDLITAFGFIGRNPCYPQELGYTGALREVVEEWRPEWAADFDS
jgi:hypothetical protein